MGKLVPIMHCINVLGTYCARQGRLITQRNGQISFAQYKLGRDEVVRAFVRAFVRARFALLPIPFCLFYLWHRFPSLFLLHQKRKKWREPGSRKSGVLFFPRMLLL